MVVQVLTYRDFSLDIGYISGKQELIDLRHDIREEESYGYNVEDTLLWKYKNVLGLELEYVDILKQPEILQKLKDCYLATIDHNYNLVEYIDKFFSKSIGSHRYYAEDRRQIRNSYSLLAYLSYHLGVNVNEQPLCDAYRIPDIEEYDLNWSDTDLKDKLNPYGMTIGRLNISTDVEEDLLRLSIYAEWYHTVITNTEVVVVRLSKAVSEGLERRILEILNESIPKLELLDQFKDKKDTVKRKEVCDE